MSILGGLVTFTNRKEGCAFYQANKYLSLILKNVWHRERVNFQGLIYAKKPNKLEYFFEKTQYIVYIIFHKHNMFVLGRFKHYTQRMAINDC